MLVQKKRSQGMWGVLAATAARAQAAVAGSRWAGIAGKAAGYLAAFALLALVGSGRLSGWLSPPAQLAVGIATAQAATAPPAASAAPIESAAPAVAPDAGAEPAATEDGGAAAAGGGVAADGKVILNLATEEDLRRLPGIGATRARNIIALRTRLKKFTRVEDLLKVKGLGRRSLARLRPLVRVD